VASLGGTCSLTEGTCVPEGPRTTGKKSVVSRDAQRWPRQTHRAAKPQDSHWQRQDEDEHPQGLHCPLVAPWAGFPWAVSSGSGTGSVL
jgi:hypothetical protein